MNLNRFEEAHVLHQLQHYLPSQTPLKDFIHHNSLHAFQDRKFYEGIFQASDIFGYQVTLQLNDYRRLYDMGRIQKNVLEQVCGERTSKADWKDWQYKLFEKEYAELHDARLGCVRAQWKINYQIDLDTAVHPLLFRIVGSYLDQGIASWQFPLEEAGFLASVKALEINSFSSFFKTKRARKLLLSADLSLEKLLDILIGKPEYYEQYLFDTQFSHRGWSGMAATLEGQPTSLLRPRPMTLREFIMLELLLEIDALDYKLGTSWQSLGNLLTEPPLDLFVETPLTELHQVLMIWQDAFEWSYYDSALTGMALLRQKPKKTVTIKNFQAIFCIDERECSLRRYIEKADETAETFGMPGFFGVEFYFQPEKGQFYDKLCPAPVTPKFLIKEYGANHEREHDILYTSHAHTMVGGYLTSLTLGFWAMGRLIQNIFNPKMSPAISNAFAHTHKNSKLTIENQALSDRENNLQIGFTVQEMVQRVENVLKGIGLTQNFAPLVYLIAHGSSSANNPHHGAHDCGACSGRPGSVNARVLSFMANHPKVRAILREKGIEIPETTQFVGGLHDTASDEMDFYDIDNLLEVNEKAHFQHLKTFDQALNNNAKERSRRFASIDTSEDDKKVRDAIRKRSVSLFEPRPELGHGTNSLCIIGKRDLTKGLFLDRRAFMNSYDCQSDLEGKLLLGIMSPIGPVCGGINLEYYFSRVDNHKLGAGTKLPHNVMGLIGVANSSDGDLRPGLPLQMIEVHDPIRLLVIVEHFPSIVLKTIQTTAAMYEWYGNEWVHLIAIHPKTGDFHRFKNGKFELYKPIAKDIQSVEQMLSVIESAKEMETNHILDATQENLPIYLLD